jgi:hypothetical protein
MWCFSIVILPSPYSCEAWNDNVYLHISCWGICSQTSWVVFFIRMREKISQSYETWDQTTILQSRILHYKLLNLSLTYVNRLMLVFIKTNPWEIKICNGQNQMNININAFLKFFPVKLNVLCSSVSFVVGKLCLCYMVRIGDRCGTQ